MTKILILILLILFNSCKNNKNIEVITKINKSDKSIDSTSRRETHFNDTLLFQYFSFDTLSHLKKSKAKTNLLKVLDSAIFSAQNKILFIQTKIRILNEEKQFDKVINLIDTLKLIDPKLNKTILDDYKIKFYLKANDIKSAMLLYNELEIKDNKILAKYPDSVGVRVNSLYRQLLFEDKSVVIKKFDEIKSKFPNNEYIIAFDQIFRDFDKKRELENLSF